MSADHEIDAAKRAKKLLLERFQRSIWFRGVGIAPSDEGLKLRINVDPETAPDPSELPLELEGIPVEVLLTKGYSPRNS
jgi:hypothetical protein